MTDEYEMVQSVVKTVADEGKSQCEGSGFWKVPGGAF